MLDNHTAKDQMGGSGRRSLRRAVPAIAIAALLGGAGIWLWRARSDPKPTYSTAPVKRGDLVATIGATGTLEPVEVVDVGAQVAGLILSFGTDKTGSTIDYGSSVEEGTILAKIDGSVYAADLALARAQVDQDGAGELRAAADLAQMKAKAIPA